MPDRFHWTTKPEYVAECQVSSCGWSSAAANAQGSAAQHHDRTGHTVRVEVVRVIVYETRDSYLARRERKA